ncbi:GAF domain-containing protein [Altericroceibacterium spongiae]|uniref:histidine kinase n=1 Tax=Altericroceibacterium spongiae TaxID=2320269 RepID=A0A420EIX1_9SPHN|nr:HWE histidine kinase domain-containing protein [Altericroceibacterium spongiae]RKF20614.1 GAF domain-containing protein [Altericroceibacterium spongiae]
MTDLHDYEVNLTNCDREPIHKLGRIQPFGALIAVTSDWIVAHRSTNIGTFLQRSVPAIGDRLQDHLSATSFERLVKVLSGAGEEDAQERVFGLDLQGNGTHFDVAMHVQGSLSIIEIEPHDEDGMADLTNSLRPIMARLEGADTAAELCKQAARQMKRLLGFDRVMVYRFHPDQSGEVVAEAREPQLESFLNLRYPKSDIPQQARKLYLRNLFRIIADVESEPVPIEPARSITGEELDLSLSTLRAVSPIHIEYLRNMGVGASLSISIVIDGKLWGLFACHHYGPRVLPYSLRTVAELFSQLFSFKLEIALARAGSILKERGRQLHDRLMSRLAGGTALVEELNTVDEVIGDVIPHDGASAFIEDAYSARGHAPTEEQFRQLIPSLNTATTSQIIETDNLSAMVPTAADFADKAVGALIIPVSRRPRDYIVLWRRELPQVVTWAGNPQKPVETGPHGDRLTPRKSFEAWQESVSGRSAPWTEEELTIAERLRVTLLEIIIRVTDEAIEERRRAQQQQDLLIAELNHRVRNILTLIRGLVSQSQADAHSVQSYAEIIGSRIRALAMAHDNITREQWESASLHELIRQEAEAYLSGKHDRVIITGEDRLLAPEAYTVIALVLHEMMTNSAKYGSLCDSAGRLELHTEVHSNGDYRLHWKEVGGPPVQPPKRKGFGTTIIERSIPFELKGDAQIDYKLTGVEAEFCIPAKFVSRAKRGKVESSSQDVTLPSGLKRPAPNRKNKTKDSALPEHVLLVEDNMIIAMDAEEALQRLGVARVTIASGTTRALQVIREETIDFALLDFNLGSESSETIAEALGSADIPFCFATGYGESITQMSETNALGVLKKPYSDSDIKALLDRVWLKSEKVAD